MRRIELLSPAKDKLCGIEAIKHGADAVYIGAPKFGARATVGNSVEDIEALTSFAHKYYARVYVALNTILTDAELREAEKIIRRLYEAGVDALIVQDFGILSLDIPPIALHASTQMDNRTTEKVQFLEKVGFSQVVLARELSFEKIREIYENTSVRLETFVHGALCVSYSGQCYMSQAFCGRSANRGECAQLCRLPYVLTDAEGRVIARNKHLLSLQDLNLSDKLRELIDAGASSLKIEGRLKDVSYVKNVTAFYRKRLDAVLDGRDYAKMSSGQCVYFFEPNLQKSFHRGGTSYFSDGRQADVSAMNTPKSTGEYVGEVCGKQKNGALVVNSNVALHNGDGLCFFDKKGLFSGFKLNKVVDNFVFPQNRVSIDKGTKLYRNYDHEFEKQLNRESAERKIAIKMVWSETPDGFELTAEDSDGISAKTSVDMPKDIAKNKEVAERQLITQLSKVGDTIFSIEDLKIETKESYFVPNSIAVQCRRALLENLIRSREKMFERDIFKPSQDDDFSYFSKSIDYRGNVHNKSALSFYKKHGVEHIEPSFETKNNEDAELMRCKHCIRYSLGICTKKIGANQYKEPLVLQSSSGWKVMLKFDCKRCEMVLKEYHLKKK